jgi:GxxExxY protein
MKDQRTYKIIGAAMEVHKELGYGFLEAVYQEALGREFRVQGIPNEAQPVIEILYKGEPLDKKYQPDYVCYGEVIVEIKALAELTGIEEAQLINYLKATGLKVGLLINFGGKSLEYRRFVNDPQITQITQKNSFGDKESLKSVDQHAQAEEDHVEGVRESLTSYGLQITQKNGVMDGESVKSVDQIDAALGEEGDLWKLSARMEFPGTIGVTRKLQFKRPLCLEVTFDERERKFVLELPELSIFLSAYTPEELYRAFCEDITWLWEEYGECEERDLSEDGLRLRRSILQLVETEDVP